MYINIPLIGKRSIERNESPVEASAGYEVYSWVCDGFLRRHLELGIRACRLFVRLIAAEMDLVVELCCVLHSLAPHSTAGAAILNTTSGPHSYANNSRHTSPNALPVITEGKARSKRCLLNRMLS